MKKAKIEISTLVDGEKTLEKYICKFNEDTIEYIDKQKTKTIIEYTATEMMLTRSGFMNYSLKHDGSSVSECVLSTQVEGQPFMMDLKIENKYYNLSKYGKIVIIEIHFLREDGCCVEQIFKVEAKC